MACTPFWQDEWGKNTALCCARSSFPLRSLVVPTSVHAVLLRGAAGCPAELRRGLGVRPRCLKGTDTPRFRGTAERLSSSSQVSAVSDSLRPHGLYSWWSSPGQNTGVGSLSLLLGIFPTQGSNPGLPHCRQIL